MASRSSLLVLSALGSLAAGCGDDAPPADGLVYWLYPNGSEVNLKLSLSKPQVPF